MIAHFHVRAPDAFGGYPPRRSAAVRATVRTFCPREEHPMRRQVVAWAAIILLGSSVATAHAQGYEKEPVLSAKDLVGPELLKVRTSRPTPRCRWWDSWRASPSGRHTAPSRPTGNACCRS